MIDFSDLILQVSNATAPAIQSGTAQPLSSVDTASSVLGISGIATGIGAAIKSVFSGKNQKQFEKETDLDQEQYIDLLDTIWTYAVEHPDKTLGQILELPAYPDDKMNETKLKEALSTERRDWKEYNKRKYYQK